MYLGKTALKIRDPYDYTNYIRIKTYEDGYYSFIQFAHEANFNIIATDDNGYYISFVDFDMFDLLVNLSNTKDVLAKYKYIPSIIFDFLFNPVYTYKYLIEFPVTADFESNEFVYKKLSDDNVYIVMQNADWRDVDANITELHQRFEINFDVDKFGSNYLTNIKKFNIESSFDIHTIHFVPLHIKKKTPEYLAWRKEVDANIKKYDELCNMGYAEEAEKYLLDTRVHCMHTWMTPGELFDFASELSNCDKEWLNNSSMRQLFCNIYKYLARFRYVSKANETRKFIRITYDNIKIQDKENKA